MSWPIISPCLTSIQLNLVLTKMYSINFVIALGAEAKPLISHFRLKKLPISSPCEIYSNKGINLAISGIGKVASAVTVGFLQGFIPASADSAWLNVGIVGHRKKAIGEDFLVNEITDYGSERSWYPPQVFQHSCSVDRVTTVDKVEYCYPEETGYEMEASGFYSSACRTTTSELVQCYKIVSDNDVESLTDIRVNIEDISDLVSSHISKIEDITGELSELAYSVQNRKLIDIADEEMFIHRWRFSFTQRARLKRQLSKAKVLGIDTSLESFTEFDNATSVLNEIENRFQSCWVQ